MARLRRLPPWNARQQTRSLWHHYWVLWAVCLAFLPAVAASAHAEWADNVATAFVGAGSMVLFYVDALYCSVFTRSHNPSEPGVWVIDPNVPWPDVAADTVWNAVPNTSAAFRTAMQARMSWLAARTEMWQGYQHQLFTPADGSWVLRLGLPMPGTGHIVACEIQEGMPASGWRYRPGPSLAERLSGPRVWVGLVQPGVQTSANFDWDLLAYLFRGTVIDEREQPVDGRAWLHTLPTFHDDGDRARWAAMDAPRWIGRGLGMAQARAYGECMFGARYRISPAATLGEIEAELRRCAELLPRMATAASLRQPSLPTYSPPRSIGSEPT